MPSRGPIAQLAEAIDDPTPYIESTEWACQRKLDGERLLVSLDHGRLQGYNRSGERRGIPLGLKNTMSQITSGPWLFDGEMIPNTETYHIFDLIESPALPMLGKPVRNLPWATRAQMIKRVLSHHQIPNVCAIPYEILPVLKRNMMDLALAESWEGVVFKRLVASYRSGRSRRWLKYKFLSEIDCQVSALGINGKANAALVVYRDDGEQVEVGHVSTLTGDGALLSVGDVVTVRCLEVSPTGRLREPTLPRLRHDKTGPECLWSQLEPLIKR